MIRLALSLASALLILVLTVLTAQAQAPPVAREVLPNGLTVLVRENDAAPVVAVSLQVRAGSRFETESTAGITNFLQRVMLRGTARRTAVQLAEASEDIGGSLDASGEVEAAEVRGQALSVHWETLLALVAEPWAVLSEAFVYALVFPALRPVRALGVSALANALSYLLGVAATSWGLIS